MKRLLYLGLCIVLSSCHQLYYVPNIQNVPLFRDKNEFRMSGSYALGDESQSGELQTAYSVTNFLGITANFMKTKIGSYEKEDFVSGVNYDVGIGYFHPVGTKAVFEVYSGFGRNRQHHGYSSTEYNPSTGTNDYISDGDAYLKFKRIYFQPAFGLVSEYFDVAASFKLSHIWYTYANYDFTNHPEDLEIIHMLNDNRNHFIIEPAITLRTGWRYVKMQFQASYAEYLNDLDSEEDFYDFVEGPHISCGFYFTLTNRWNRK